MASSVARHYSFGNILSGIEAGLEKVGKTVATVTPAETDMFDQFHIGGRDSAAALLGTLGLSATDAVLDVGSGLGGPARQAASTFGCAVTGLDVTEEFVSVANAVSAWPGVDLAGKVR